MNPTWNNGQYDVCGCKARGHYEKCEFYYKHDSEYIDYYGIKRVEEMEKDIFYSNEEVKCQGSKPIGAPTWELEKALGIKKYK